MSEVYTIPMPTDEIQNLFLNPDKVYEIDLKGSKLKGEAFATYLANMKIKCSLTVDSETPKEEKFNLMKEFLVYPYMIECDTLINQACDLFLLTKGIPFSTGTKWMSQDEMVEFLKSNEELVRNISSFLESMILTVPSFNNDFREKVLEPALESCEIESIEDPTFVSVNVFGLLKVPSFLEFFLSKPPVFEDKPKYYKYQVEKFTYDQKSLYDIFMELKGDSFLMSLTNMFTSDEKEETEARDNFVASIGAE